MRYAALLVNLLLTFGSSVDPLRLSQYVSPSLLAKRVADKILHYQRVFLVWDYGGALIFDGLYQINETFNYNYAAILDTYLDGFERNPGSYGYRILHGEVLPTQETVGDVVGLFPIAYLDRILSGKNVKSMWRNLTGSADAEIVYRVAMDYVFKWPNRLRDGTFSREKGWAGQPTRKASFVWADDQYMGLTLLTRLGRATGVPNLVAFAAQMLMQFQTHLRDPLDHIIYHGYNGANGNTSCCKWGRANGWSLMAQVEVLQAMAESPTLRRSPLFTQLLKAFTIQAQTVVKYQSQGGRFHQVINDSSTYLETSATAMFLTSLARAVMQGWLPWKQYDDPIKRAWRGLSSAVEEDGTVKGICMGTGIQLTVADYEARPTVYLLSGDGGLGAVLQAAVSMHDYNKYIDRA